MSDVASHRTEHRLTVVGNVPVDLTLRLPRLPRPGEDLRGSHPRVRPGGGYHVLAAAARAGLLGRFAGVHGVGPLGDLVRAALADLGCELVLPPRPAGDTGWSVGFVDVSGERTFVTSSDAVVAYSRDVLSGLPIPTGDLVYVSGYNLGLGAASRALGTWVGGLPADHVVFCDLGPWGSAAAGDVLEPVLARADWLACNPVEATRATGARDPEVAAAALRRRTQHAGVLVRAGSGGCWYVVPDGTPHLVPTRPVRPGPDTTGAGDTHSGAFLAALARGDAAGDAVAAANLAVASMLESAGSSRERRAIQPPKPAAE